MAMSHRLLRPKAAGNTLPQFTTQGYARVWGVTTKSSGNVTGTAESDTGKYAVKWWDNTTTVYDSGDPFSKAAAGNQRAFEVYPAVQQSTALLLNFNGSNGSTTFTDSSPNGLTVTANGDAEISTAQSKFGGASGYFDGTGDYLEIAHNESLELSGVDWTIEMWIRAPSLVSTRALLSKGASGTVTNCWSLEASGADNISLYASENNAELAEICSATLPTGVWAHLAISNEGGTVRMFVDGELEDTGALNLSSTASTPLIVGAGWFSPSDRGFDGYIDDLRIVRGFAVYTAAFTPPAAQLTAIATSVVPSGQFDGFDISNNALTRVRSEGVTLADGGAGGYAPGTVPTWYGGYYSVYVSGSPTESAILSGNLLSAAALDEFYTDLDAGGGDIFVTGNPGIDADDPTIATAKGYTVFGSVPPGTALLLNFNGTNGSTTFTDSSANGLTATAVGAAVISTAESKWGGASLYLNGSSAVSVEGLPSYISTGDFTIEAWVLVGSGSAGALFNSDPHNSVYIGLRYEAATSRVFLGDGASWLDNFPSSGTLADDEWHHIALVRSGAAVVLYHDGVAQGSSLTLPSGEGAVAVIGGYSFGGGFFTGYIDDFRIVKGAALYTANFTPPAAQLGVYP